MLIFIVRIVGVATILNLVQARLPVKSESGQLSDQYFMVPHRCHNSNGFMVYVDCIHVLK